MYYQNFVFRLKYVLNLFVTRPFDKYKEVYLVLFNNLNIFYFRIKNQILRRGIVDGIYNLFVTFTINCDKIDHRYKFHHSHMILSYII